MVIRVHLVINRTFADVDLHKEGRATHWHQTRVVDLGLPVLHGGQSHCGGRALTGEPVAEDSLLKLLRQLEIVSGRIVVHIYVGAVDGHRSDTQGFPFITGGITFFQFLRRVW